MLSLVCHLNTFWWLLRFFLSRILNLICLFLNNQTILCKSGLCWWSYITNGILTSKVGTCIVRWGKTDICIRNIRNETPISISRWVNRFLTNDIINDCLTILKIEETFFCSILNTREVTSRTIVVSHDKESLIQINGFTLISQVTNTTSIWVNQLTFTIVFVRLCQIKLISQPINHIVIVWAIATINELLWLFAIRINLIELSCRHFQPFFYLCTSHLE